MDQLKQTELLGLDLQQLRAILADAAQPPYRARQLFEALYRQRVSSLHEVTVLPLASRRLLAEQGNVVGQPSVEKKFVSLDGTIRYLLALRDRETVEAVWMPEGDDGEAGDTEGETDPAAWKRATICISSQVGCAVNCQFCMTALLGARRNLTAGEIAGQVIAILNNQEVDLETRRVNLVFMGMGEPFLNYDNFIKAVRLLVEGVGIPESRMTVSTAGIVPRIYDFGNEAIRPKLAISLNASNDALRDRLMPINRKWDLQALLGAARVFPLRGRERLTFEYVLLHEVNDSAGNAREMVELLRGLRAKVNLIALNPGPDLPFQTPQAERVHRFQNVLIAAGIPTFLRRPRGRDIFAACGQLKLTTS